MPKIKTKSAAAKRFKKTGSGHIKRGAAFRRHILSGKTTKRKRQLRASKLVSENDMKSIIKMMPY